MADLKARSSQVLRHLTNAPGPVTVGQLARQFGVSKRTVRYDLQAIDDWLVERGFPRLGKRPRVGVWADADRTGILGALASLTPQHYILSPRERLRAVLLTLFSHGEPVSSATLALRLSVSKVTVARDLLRARKWLDSYDLRLELVKQGYRVCGSETNLRRAVLDLLFGGMDTADILRMLDSYRRPEYPLDPPRGKNVDSPPPRESVELQPEVFSLFNGFDLGFVEQCVLAAQDDLGVQFADTAFAALVIHLAIAVKRLQIGRCIQMPEGQLATLRDSSFFEVARGLAEKVQRRFGVTVPEAEVDYISLHLQGTRVQVAEKAPAVEQLARRVAREAERILGLPLSQDDKLISGLALHLGPAVHRLVNGMPPIVNPLEADIERDYPAVCLAAKQACQALQEVIGVVFPKSEVAYVAIHLGAAVERISRGSGITSGHPKILVVCATGVGTANLLASRLNTEFPLLEIAGVHSLRQAKSLSRRAFDLIISTVPVPTALGPVLYVNPLLPPPDVARVSAFLVDLRLTETNKPHDAGRERRNAAPPYSVRLPGERNPDRSLTTAVVDDITSLVAKHARITDPDRLHAALLHYISRLQGELVRGGRPMLTDLLTRETIGLRVTASCWEDAVRAAGRLLVDTGGVVDSYVEAMVDTIREMGPYVVVVPGVALAHARPETGVKTICMSLVQLASPVMFGAGLNDPVHLVFAFGAIDHDSHLNALSRLARILGNREQVKGLRHARSKSQVLGILRADSGGGDKGSKPNLSGERQC
ncbi:MAG: BglG family transcription antiterminator [Firmicutes bacterium]|nr:BglG family transcription antiterminator [Bacillota bacterium]